MKFRKLLSTLVVAMMVTVQLAPLAVLAEGETTDPNQTTTEQSGDTTSEGDGTSSPSTTQSDPEPTQGPTASPTSPTSPTNNQTGPAEPTGVIPKYAFDESANKWVPTKQDTFYWDTTAKRWLSPFYRYNSQNGWYYVIPQPAPQPAPVSQPSTSTASASPTGTSGTSGTTGTASATDTTKSEAAKKLAQLLGLPDPVNRNTGAGSTNIGTVTNSNDILLEILSRATVNNDLDSTATTGTATVDGNTNGGSATSGMAEVVANLINLINSAWGWANGGLAYFAQNFMDDHTGDIMLSPQATTGGGGGFGCLMCIAGSLNANENTGPDSTNLASTTNDNDLTIVNRPEGTINNDLNLLAQSGDANVTGNTNGGNATTGDALATINIMNLINSAIGAGQSFFGMLNIFGNLDGDILFPAGFLDSAHGPSAGPSSGTIIATNENTGPESDNTVTADNSNTVNITDQTTANFNNNINTASLSGNADVSSNTEGGDAATGSATTNTTTHNLFGSSIFGENAVLVLVNVLGRWTGMIMNLPTGGGSGSALLTGGAILQNVNTGPNSTNTASSTNSNTVDILNAPVATINNNINAGAISGNAAVTGNTRGGNATSGDAYVAANVANIINSYLGLNQWFGVLMINVFGDWNGSVNQDTAAGTLIAPAGLPGQGGGTLAANSAPQSAQSSALAPAQPTPLAYSGPTAGSAGSVNATSTSVGGGSSIKTLGAQLTDKQVKAEKAAKGASLVLVLMAGGMMIAAAGLAGLERKLKSRQ